MTQPGLRCGLKLYLKHNINRNDFTGQNIKPHTLHFYQITTSLLRNKPGALGVSRQCLFFKKGPLPIKPVLCLSWLNFYILFDVRMEFHSFYIDLLKEESLLMLISNMSWRQVEIANSLLGIDVQYVSNVTWELEDGFWELIFEGSRGIYVI